MRNRVLSVSDQCEINNSYGSFRLAVFLTEVQTGVVEPVPVLTSGSMNDGILLRVNSACVTSEAFGDTSCDCAWQLNSALELIARERAGMIIYCFSHEGRGAGIFHKVNSMRMMQTRNMTTRGAFDALGLSIDQRDFSFVGDILRHCGIRRVRLMTNNPQKRSALQQAGIVVDDEVRLVSSASHLAHYLKSKQEELGHAIDLNPSK